MDKLSIFSRGEVTGEVTLTSEGGATLDTIAANQDRIVQELVLTRKGLEEGVFDEEVKENENIDLSELVVEEDEDNG